MKSLLLFLFLFTYQSAMAQDAQNPFYDQYEAFRQEGLEERRFKQQDILPMIRSLQDVPGFTVTKVGESVEGRDIQLVKVGNGNTRILLWSQMHGDEPTATMALMDIFNFFKDPQELDSIRQLLLNELSIYFIPMLNPDGAEVYERRNALGIDLNRDALRLQSPEARILKSIRDSIQADWGFNLHDQNILYSAGKSAKPATISLLAPPYDEEGSINEVRSKAIKLVVELNKTLQQYIPGQVGKWSDEFEPRAFGDNIQKWGTSTVLIESGGYKGDVEKQYIRKLNFVAIMQGLHSIASGSYAGQDMGIYEEIPVNDRYLFNLLIRNARLELNGKEYVVDIGINRSEKGSEGQNDFYNRSHIEDVGDLSVFSGYEELDAEGMKIVPGKIYPKTFKNIEAIEKKGLDEILRSGYTAVRLRNLPEEDYTSLPVNLLQKGLEKEYSIKEGAQPNFLLMKGGRVQNAIVNGFVYNLEAAENGVKNSLVEREK